MHCRKCCLHLSKNKNGTVPVHYVQVSGFFSDRDDVCAGSGTRDFWEDHEVRRGQCDRPRSRNRCPTCNRPLTLTRNGRIPKHKDGGRPCRYTP